jgi:PadR family transcriptional regulator PadR
LRREQLVDYEWRESGVGPPRKYYRLTEAGQQALSELQGYWNHLTDTLTRIGN